MWGAMLDYYHYTGDSSYNEVVSQALVSQVGPAFDFIMPNQEFDEGNDDQAFWGFASMVAAERDFPIPSTGTGGFSWLQLTENLWNNIASRWDTSTCNGGLKWQIYASNKGYDYKNMVSNGALFQLSARLAKVTGNQTYVTWANQIYDWSTNVGFVTNDFVTYDGAPDNTNCTPITKEIWTYNNAIMLYGAAVMYNITGSSTWQDRTNSFLGASAQFFSPYANSTNVMFELMCETGGTCDNDQFSFKGYLSRFMYASTQVAPFTHDTVFKYLTTSASAAAKSCSGGTGGTTCGQRWYWEAFDGSVGVGQQMSALETIQGLLVDTPGGADGQAGTSPSVSSISSAVQATSTMPTAAASAITASSGGIFIASGKANSAASSITDAVAAASAAATAYVTTELLTTVCTNSSTAAIPTQPISSTNTSSPISPTKTPTSTLLTATSSQAAASSYTSLAIDTSAPPTTQKPTTATAPSVVNPASTTSTIPAQQTANSSPHTLSNGVMLAGVVVLSSLFLGA